MKKLRTEANQQTKHKRRFVKGVQTYLNELKNDLTTYQGFKIRLVILKILGKYTDIF